MIRKKLLYDLILLESVIDSNSSDYTDTDSFDNSGRVDVFDTMNPDNSTNENNAFDKDTKAYMADSMARAGAFAYDEKNFFKVGQEIARRGIRISPRIYSALPKDYAISLLKGYISELRAQGRPYLKDLAKGLSSIYKTHLTVAALLGLLVGGTWAGYRYNLAKELSRVQDNPKEVAELQNKLKLANTAALASLAAGAVGSIGALTLSKLYKRKQDREKLELSRPNYEVINKHLRRNLGLDNSEF